MKKIIKDGELHLLMKRLREVVGADCKILFKTTVRGSRLVGAYYDDDEEDDDGDDDTPLYDFDEIGDHLKRGTMFKRTEPKLEGRKHDLRKPIYFG